MLRNSRSFLILAALQESQESWFNTYWVIHIKIKMPTGSVSKNPPKGHSRTSRQGRVCKAFHLSAACSSERLETYLPVSREPVKYVWMYVSIHATPGRPLFTNVDDFQREAPFGYKTTCGVCFSVDA